MNQIARIHRGGRATAIAWSLALTVAIPPVFAEELQPSRNGIAGLIQRLGSRDAADRGAVRDRLLKIGGPAIAALRDATRDEDLETAGGARLVLATMARLAAEQRDTLRPAAKIAFDSKHYETALDIYQRLCLPPDAAVQDRVGLARALEAVERYAEAVEACRVAVAAIERRLAAAPDPPPPAPLFADRFHRGPVWTPESARQKLEREKTELRPLRLELLCSLGRMQRDKIRDPVAAEAAFHRAVDEMPALMEPSIRRLSENYLALLKDGRRNDLCGPRPLAEHIVFMQLLTLRLQCLRELAATHLAEGQADLAVDELSRVALAEAITGGNGTYIDVKGLWEAMRRLPPGDPPPDPPMLHVLSPGRTLRIEPITPGAQAASWFWQYTKGGMRAYRFHVCAPPGQRLVSIEIRGDVERKSDAHGGYGLRFLGLSDDARLGAHEFPPRKRTVIKRHIAISPDAGESLLDFELMTTADPELVIHSIEITGLCETLEIRAAEGPR